jgi:hypothetical protein
MYFTVNSKKEEERNHMSTINIVHYILASVFLHYIYILEYMVDSKHTA